MTRLALRRLAVRRMPGITEGYELGDLAAGVNLIYGPNASGKTTTAKAVEALLWPRAAAPANASLEANIDLADDVWSVRIDAGLVDCQENGVPADALPAAPSEGRDRYRLWLPDLLWAEDGGFARAILIESSGGFDLEAAARVLDARRPLHRQRSQQADLRQARERVREALRVQAALSGESARLAEKEARLLTRLDLEARLRLLRAAAEHAERRDEGDAARERVASYPVVLGRLRGDEAEQLSGLRSRLADAEVRFHDASCAKGRAEQGLRRLALPAEVVSGDVLHCLAADAERLAEQEREIAEQDRYASAAATRLAEEEAPLATTTDVGRLATFGLEGLEHLDRAIEAAEEVREERRRLQAEISSLPDEPPAEDIDRLHHGVVLLRQWQAAHPPASPAERSLRLLVIAASVVVGLTAIGFLLLSRPVPAAVAAVAGIVLLYRLWRIPSRVDSRPDREREYLELELPEAPDPWDPHSVEANLARLDDRIEHISSLDRAWRRRQQLIAQRHEVERRGLAADQGLRDVAAEFGLDVQTAGVRLLWLVQRISRWQKAHAERIAAEAALVQAYETQRVLLEDANRRLASIGLDPLTESRALKGRVEKLRQDLLAHERLSHALAEAESAIERDRAEIARLRTAIKRLVDRIDLAPEEEHMLAEWCARADEYRASSREYELVEGQRLHLERRLRAMAGFETPLLESSRDGLAARAAELEQEVEAVVALGEEVGALRARLDDTKAGHALEDALAEETRRRDALLELRVRDLRAAVAALLVEHVERETRNEHLPQVYHRANQLFIRITHGAYELRVGLHDPPTFRAFDTRTERGLALDELSSGTRVQLLLAVRIAFVEAREAGIALPLLMDETLANSDDERAAAIIDAVVQLAAEGRQVFYFTAQPDELAKWSRALAERPDVSWTRIDLAELRRLGRRLDFEALDAHVPSHAMIPTPGGMPHDEYGKVLSVPAIDLHAPTGALHLWYVVEELELLHHILADLRLSSWAELNSLILSGGRPLLDDSALEGIRLRFGMADGAIKRLRIGRGRRVDRAALLDSGAVSDRFIDEVDALCRELGGDAGWLIEQLESRAVPKFYQRNVEALGEYFETEQYLDARAPARIETIRLEIVREHASTLATGNVTFDEIDRLLRRLAGGAGCVDPATAEPLVEQSQLWPDPPA